MNLIGNGMLALLRHPDELRRLRADPALTPSAVEECLRYDSPVQRTARIPSTDVELDGHTIREGTMVVAAIGAANRDPADLSMPTASTSAGVRTGTCRSGSAFMSPGRTPGPARRAGRDRRADQARPSPPAGFGGAGVARIVDAAWPESAARHVDSVVAHGSGARAHRGRDGPPPGFPSRGAGPRRQGERAAASPGVAARVRDPATHARPSTAHKTVWGCCATWRMCVVLERPT